MRERAAGAGAERAGGFRAQLEELRAQGGDAAELEARRLLLACEGEAARLGAEERARGAELAEVAPRVRAASARGAQLVALRPLATLLRCALRVNACAADRAAAARAAEEAEEERLGRHAQRRAELDALAAENAAARRAALLAAARRVCTRCGEEFFEDESNTAFSCCWHPGPRVVLATWGAAYECCRRNGRGCATAKHTAPDPVLPGDPWQPPLPAQPRRVFGATLQPPAPPDEPTYSVPAGAKYPEAGSFRYPAGLR
jgi:hypothetical protein